MVKGMLLNTTIELDGLFQCLFVASGAYILRQAVDGKADGIELLLRVLWLSLVVKAPIDTTILFV